MSLKFTMSIVVSAACFSSSFIIPCFPYIISTFDITPADISLLVSIFLFGYLLGQIAYSFIINKFGYRKALITGFFILIFSNIFQLISIKVQFFQLFIISRFFCALGGSAGLVCIFAYIVDIAIDSNALKKLVSMLFISLTLAAYLSITVSGLIINFINDYAVFLLLLILSIIQIILIYTFIDEADINKKKNSKSHLKMYFLHFFNVKLILASLIASFATITTYLFNATGAILATTSFKLSPKLLGIYCLFNLFGLIIGSNIYSKLIKQDSIKILGYALIICLLPISILIFNKTYILTCGIPIYFFIAIGVLNIGVGVLYPCASFIALNSSKCTPSASSILSFFKIFCPALTVYIVSRLNLTIDYSFINPMCVIYVITVIFYFLLIFKENEKQPS